MCRLFVPYRYIRTQSIVFLTLIHGGIMNNFGKYLESKRIVTKKREGWQGENASLNCCISAPMKMQISGH